MRSSAEDRQFIHAVAQQNQLSEAAVETLFHAVQAGHDRQKVHEGIRQHSLAAMERVKAGQDNDLLQRLQQDVMFKGIDIETICAARQFVGRSPEQVDAFLAEVVEPLLAQLDPNGAEAVHIHI